MPFPAFPMMTRPNAGDPRPWFEFCAKADDGPAVIKIYDHIGGWYGLTAKDFAAELDKISADEITLRINSAGGDVFDGFAIYNLLRDHPAKITAVVDGFAASIASIIALAADSIEVHEASVVMIHDPWGIGIGNASELRDLADVLDKTIAVPMSKVYADKMNITTKEARKLMVSETWYTGEEAVENGFADVLISSDATEDAAASNAARDFSGFRNPPADLAGHGGDSDPVPAPEAAAEAEAAADAALVELMKRRLRLQELDD